VRSSSEAEPHSRGRSALDRAGTSLEGGAQPPSEAESRARGRPAPERGGTSPEGVTNPQARRSFTSAAPCPSSEAGSARGWLGRLLGGPWARGFISRVFLGSFAFVFYEDKRVFPGCLGDPYGCPRQSSSSSRSTARLQLPRAPNSWSAPAASPLPEPPPPTAAY
jgi:hypothetical protein